MMHRHSSAVLFCPCSALVNVLRVRRCRRHYSLSAIGSRCKHPSTGYLMNGRIPATNGSRRRRVADSERQSAENRRERCRQRTRAYTVQGIAGYQPRANGRERSVQKPVAVSCACWSCGLFLQVRRYAPSWSVCSTHKRETDSRVGGRMLSDRCRWVTCMRRCV